MGRRVMGRWWLVGILVLCLVCPVFAKSANQKKEARMPLAVARKVNQVSLLMGQNKLNEAVALLEKATASGDAYYYLDFLLGNCRLMLDRDASQTGNGKAQTKKAAADFARAVEKQPDMDAAWFNLARCRYELGENEAAAQAFVRAYETAETPNAETLYYGAVCYAAAQKESQSLAVFQRLIRDHRPEMKPAWKEALVNVFFSLEKFKESLPWIKELTRITTGEKQKKWREVLLSQYMNLGMEKAALEYAHFLTREDTLEPKWWKALAHIRLNRYQKVGRDGDGGPTQALTALVVYSYLSPLKPSETRLLSDLYSACNVPVKAADALADWIAATEAQLNQAAEENPDAKTDWTSVVEKHHALALARVSSGNLEAALVWTRKGLDRARQHRVKSKTTEKLARLKGILIQMIDHRNIEV